MIGLKRHTVQVVEHQPEWSALAYQAILRIRAVCGELALDIQHVGSTSVAGLPAKPILDIAVAVATLDRIPDVIPRLTGIEYIYRGNIHGSNEREAGDHLFVYEVAPDIRTEHVHVVEIDGDHWMDYLQFREILRANTEIREQYAQLKHELQERFSEDRKSYSTGSMISSVVC